MNLGATPQLECWNTGILEKWILEKWDYVVMAKNLPTYKLKVSISEKTPLKTNVPSFHMGVTTQNAIRIAVISSACRISKT